MDLKWHVFFCSQICCHRLPLLSRCWPGLLNSSRSLREEHWAGARVERWLLPCCEPTKTNTKKKLETSEIEISVWQKQYRHKPTQFWHLPILFFVNEVVSFKTDWDVITQQDTGRKKKRKQQVPGLSKGVETTRKLRYSKSNINMFRNHKKSGTKMFLNM